MKVVLGFGGNIGNTQNIIRQAYQEVNRQVGNITGISSFYCSQSWGFESKDFINSAIIVETKLSKQEILHRTQNIEKQLGRTRKTKDNYQPRVIDIDILFYGDEVYQDENLTIPHPKIQDRNFVLYPLNEIIPDYYHPVFNKKIHDLFHLCKDPLRIHKL